MATKSIKPETKPSIDFTKPAIKQEVSKIPGGASNLSYIAPLKKEVPTPTVKTPPSK